MNFGVLTCVILSTVGWGFFLLSTKKLQEKDDELRRRNTELSLLYVTLQQLRASKGGGERIVYRNRPTEIPKGTIDAVRFAMKVSHPDNGGKEEDFIKYSEVYQKLTGRK